MSPEKAKVFVAAPDQGWQEIIKNELEKAGHKVVLTASTLEEALAAIKQLNELGVQVATSWGSFRDPLEIARKIIEDPDGDFDLDEALTAGGRKLLMAIRTATPEIKTVEITGPGLSKLGAKVRVSTWEIEKLGEVVTKL